MPELPEVETLRRGVENHITGRRLQRVELRRKDLRWPIPVARVRKLATRRCQLIERRAKYLLFHFDGDTPQVAMVHLGMSGRLFVDRTSKDDGEPDWIEHEHWRMHFDGRLMRFIDARRFGMLDVTRESRLSEHPRLIGLGPEPLEPDFDGEYLFQISRRRKISIKTLIMNASMVVGVGNIYASEACFRAGLRPRRAAGSMTRKHCQDLVACIREVLSEAIESGGTTIRDYRGVAQEAGYFARELRVYGREGEPCRTCASPIRRVVETGRSSFYCPTCQG
ncbi:MAG: bifunctional DNA-formamidopyrimidine glycosylase/DNA-(apurinic or apyrimidinic site) lyase [Planctomycetota bacterium]